ncbi:MAG: DUF1553 domain-containing protein [Bryobacteraceae bacterium]
MRLGLVLAGCALSCAMAAQLRVEPAKVSLNGSGARQQFLVLEAEADGTTRDVTAEAKWQVSKPVGMFETSGRFSVSADGAAVVTATVRGQQAKAQVEVTGSAQARPFRFSRDIEGILTRRGCNSAGCHGGVKGRGGLKLSASAQFPKDDYEWIVKGGAYQVLTTEVKGERKPRIDVANPAKSLLLMKPTGEVPHAGGKRFDKDSDDYRTIETWVRNGAPYGAEGEAEPAVTRLEITPRLVTLAAGATHRLLVTATYSDGHTEDFTHQVTYGSNDSDTAKVDSAGVVTAVKPGETAVLVRAAGQAVAATIGVVSAPVARYPETPVNNFIDRHVFAKLKRFQIVPSDVAGDGEFLRRICLDLTGTLPPPERAREFVASRDPRKREKLIETLLETPEFVDYWTFRFSDLFRVAIFSNGITPKWSQMYWEWVHDSIAQNKPYDEMARERIRAQGYDGPSRHFLPYNVIGPPEETMAEQVRVFFGRRLDCAQCHNHPYENWSQDQFWGMAAFFGRMFKMGDTGTEYVIFDHPLDQEWGNRDVNGTIRTMHPRTKAVVKPALLTGEQVNADSRVNPRIRLAEWMTAHPFFAEAAVNRVWSNFFGRGIVDPVDDFRSTNPPSHPELLTELAEDFRKNGHDMKRLMRMIVSSRTYQLSARTTANNSADAINYSHSRPRALDAEVLLDAISAVTGVPEIFTNAVSEVSTPTGAAPPGTRAIQLHEPDAFFSRFLELYGRPNRLQVPERSTKPNLSQALHTLAGPSYLNKLNAKTGRLRNLLEAGAGNGRIIEEFYMAALTRLPSKEEAAELEAEIAKHEWREAALGEFVWALICSREFAENH